MGFVKSLHHIIFLSSLAIVEEKTAAFVKGTINAKAYSRILTAAFGDKLSKVLPDILFSLPAKSAADLKKVLK